MEDFSFSYVDVKDEIVQVFKAALPKFGYADVKVLKSDPQSDREIPCLGVNRANTSEDSQSIADASGDVFNPVTKTLTRIRGTFMREAMEVRIWHTNADERDKLFPTMMATLFAMRPGMVEKGILNLTLQNGRDEQDSTMQQAPMVLYWSTVTMSYLNPLDINITEVVPVITAINDNLIIK